MNRIRSGSSMTVDEYLTSVAYQDQLEENMRKLQQLSLEGLQDNEIMEVECRKLPRDFQRVKNLHGKEYELRPEPLGLIYVNLRVSGTNNRLEVEEAYGLAGDQYLICGLFPKGWVTPIKEEAKNAVIHIESPTTPEVTRFNMFYQYELNGEEKTIRHKGQGVDDVEFIADKILRVGVKRTSRFGWIKLSISMNGDSLYETQPMHGRESLWYTP